MGNVSLSFLRLEYISHFMYFLPRDNVHACYIHVSSSYVRPVHTLTHQRLPLHPHVPYIIVAAFFDLISGKCACVVGT